MASAPAPEDSHLWVEPGERLPIGLGPGPSAGAKGDPCRRVGVADVVGGDGARVTGPTGRRPQTRVDALDGLRGIAVAAVLWYHAAPSSLPGGFLGVDVFFVLSGFLLSTLLLEEHDRSGHIDLRRYASRRVRRVVPALVVFVAVLLALGPLVVPDDAHRLPGDALSSLFGLTNWHLIHDGSSYFSRLGRPPLVRHLWSLAIEIQFYVACPFVVGWLAVRRRRAAVNGVLGAIGASSVAMAMLYRRGDPSRAYFGTDARVGALLVGTLLALLLLRPRRHRRPTLTHRGVALVGVVGLSGLVTLFALAGDRSRAMYPTGFLVAEAATALAIVAGLRRGPVSRLLGMRPLRWLGQRSYSIYLWHWPFIALLRPGQDVDWPRPLAAVCAVTGAIVVGEASFRLVERPFLRARPSRLRATPGRAVILQVLAATVAVAVLGLLLARVPTNDPIAQSLRAGEHAIASQPAAPGAELPGAAGGRAGGASLVVAAAPASPAATAVATTAPAPAPGRPHFALPLPPPVPGRSVTAIGDSVMVGAAKPLQARLGASGFVDAHQSRQWRQGVDEVRQLRAQNRLGRVVIVHLGTNGPVKASDIDAMMRELAGAQAVRLVTVRVAEPWEEATNRALAAAPDRFPTVRLVDWHAYADGHPDWFYSDGAHLRGDGAQAYADLLAGSLPVPPSPAPSPSPATAPPTPATAPPTPATAPPTPATAPVMAPTSAPSAGTTAPPP